MKVFFAKLPCGDWICYDRFNEGGDRFALELNELPAFDIYVYKDVGVADHESA